MVFQNVSAYPQSRLGDKEIEFGKEYTIHKNNG
jgi:hypothetical protein